MYLHQFRKYNIPYLSIYIQILLIPKNITYSQYQESTRQKA